MTQEVDSTHTPEAATTDGVAIGVVLGIDEKGSPMVSFPGAGTDSISARTTVELSIADIGAQVALLFEAGRLDRPLVIGRLLVPGGRQKPSKTVVDVERDHERLTLSADREIVLKCGKASITLTRAGKIILRGAYVLSRSSGVNKIKGASVQIN